MKTSLFARPASAFITFALVIVGAIALVSCVDAYLAATAVEFARAQALGWDHVQVVSAGPALEILSGFVTAPSNAFTAWTMGSGDSLQIRNCDPSKAVKLLSMWGDNQGAGQLRVRSPKLHDNVRGITANVSISDVVPLQPFGQSQKLVPQDVLIAEQTGSAVGGDIESGSLLIYYEDAPGQAARFITPDELMKRGVNVKPVENTLALGAAGGYSGSEAINAEEDLLKANTDYALIGYLLSAECCTIAWRGADTGNLRVGGPGNETLKHVTGDWFRRLSLMFNLPLIPVINSANKSNTFLDGVQDENGTDVTVNSILVELAPR